MIYFTADHHFEHKKIINYCDRPFATIDDMRTVIINRHNRTVSPKDIVFFIGDFALYTDLDYLAVLLKQMNGYKILVKGNHDHLSRSKYIKAGFNDYYKSSSYTSYNGKMFYLSHFPDKLDYDGNEILYPVICGHVHQRYRVKNQFINVGVDAWNYFPVSFYEICQLLEDNQNFDKFIEIKERDGNG